MLLLKVVFVFFIIFVEPSKLEEK